MDDRRGLPRWQIKRKAKVWLSETQQFDEGTIENINLKGMCVALYKPLSPQQPVAMSFLGLDGSLELMKIEAMVAWSKEAEGRYVYGLCFSKIKDLDKEKINQYIINNCYKQFRQKWWAAP